MLNQCQFIGNLGADPEIRNTQSGNKIANLRLAVSERWKDNSSGEKRERTEWVPVVIFNEHLVRIAEQYLSKGSRVFVSGQFSTRKWQDQNGQDRYSTEVVLRPYRGELKLLGGKPDGGQAHGGYSPPSQGAAPELEDEIPFFYEARL